MCCSNIKECIGTLRKMYRTMPTLYFLYFILPSCLSKHAQVRCTDTSAYKSSSFVFISYLLKNCTGMMHKCSKKRHRCHAYVFMRPDCSVHFQSSTGMILRYLIIGPLTPVDPFLNLSTPSKM